tara:strand:+ start:491 stop:1390 length:900 start_codon:yes stop_codon:yes gene_type:complete
MIPFQRITEYSEDCYVQFDYCRTWRKPFKAVDARFVLLETSRIKALDNLDLFVKKLMWINGDKSARDIIVYIKGLYVTISKRNDIMSIVETDINMAVNKAFRGEDFSFGEEIYSYPHNEWGDAISKLVELTVEDHRVIDSQSSEIWKLKKKALILRAKKQVYGTRCVATVRKDNTMIEIISAIQVIKETEFDNDLSAQRISDVSGVSLPTVYRYITEMQEVLDIVSESGGLYNKNTAKHERKSEDIEEAAKELYREHKKITQSAIHNVTGISRTTIRKHWKSFEILFNELNQTLHNKNI